MILLTGASGFLGGFIKARFANDALIALGRKNADILCDLSLEIPELPSLYLVVHCAGKAHSVPKTDAQKQEFFDVNVKGTVNLLKGLARAPALPKAFVYISSVAVYGVDVGTDINENHPLLAQDPYGLSKIQAEHLIQKWCEDNNVVCAILRLPLIVGKSPLGNLKAMIKGIEKGYYFNVAGGLAKKSMVMAEDVARIIPKLAEVSGIYNLTDGYHPSFYELSSLLATQLNRKKLFNIPLWLAKPTAIIGDVFSKFPLNSNKLMKITSDLTFDDSEARDKLGWKPSKVLTSFLIK